MRDSNSHDLRSADPKSALSTSFSNRPQPKIREKNSHLRMIHHATYRCQDNFSCNRRLGYAHAPNALARSPGLSRSPFCRLRRQGEKGDARAPRPFPCCLPRRRRLRQRAAALCTPACSQNCKALLAPEAVCKTLYPDDRIDLYRQPCAPLVPLVEPGGHFTRIVRAYAI